MVARARAVEEARKNKEVSEREGGMRGVDAGRPPPEKERKELEKRVRERERESKCKTTRGSVLARTYGRAIIYWRVGTSEGSGVRAGRVVLHSRGC